MGDNTKTQKNFNNIKVVPSNSNEMKATSTAFNIEATALGGGHFEKWTKELTRQVMSGGVSDSRLCAAGIEALRAHIKMLIRKDIVSETEGKKIVDGLEKIKKTLSDGKFVYDHSIGDGIDNIKAKLHEMIGESADYLFIAISKNDLLATMLKLWVRDAYDAIDGSLENLQAALIDKADGHEKTIMLGLTHMQSARTISLGHQLMAYVEMVGRDRARVKSARKIMNQSPLGSNDLGGTSFNINREMDARSMNFDGATLNSIDSVCDVDFVADFTATSAVVAMHLSRVAEDLILWHHPNYKYISFSDAFVTIDPVYKEKRNLELAELVRGRVGKVYGALINILTNMKGLATSYNSDIIEARGPIFDAYDSVFLSINTIAAMINDFVVNRKEMKEALSEGQPVVSDLVEWLIQNTGSMPSKARATAKKIVNLSVEKDKKLSLLELEDMKKIEPKINDDIYSVLIPSRSIIARRSNGGTNPVQVRKAIRAARRNYL